MQRFKAALVPGNWTNNPEPLVRDAKGEFVLYAECKCANEKSSEALTERLLEMQDAIDQFCKESDWAAEIWKKQPCIKRLFELRSKEPA